MSQDILHRMFRLKRPAGSRTEKELIETYLVPLGAQRDAFGNYWLIVGDEKPTVMWSCHTDTVHSSDGHQKVQFQNGIWRLHKKASSSCLGADDTAGIWIMIMMILEKVPGLYMFHYAEERGAIGSSAVAHKNPEFVKGIQMAIAFDRKGKDSIITHQGSRTCSDAFAESLAKQMPGFKKDPTGLFTDTKSYAGLIPECTNLSVGYEGAHTSSEHQDWDHLVRLLDMMLKLDTKKLVVERDPSVVEHRSYYQPRQYGGYSDGHWGSNYSRGWAGRSASIHSKDDTRRGHRRGSNPTDFDWLDDWQYGEYSDRYFDDPEDYYASASKGPSQAGSSDAGRDDPEAGDESIYGLIWNYPEDVAEVIADLGIDWIDLASLVLIRRTQAGNKKATLEEAIRVYRIEKARKAMKKVETKSQLDKLFPNDAKEQPEYHSTLPENVLPQLPLLPSPDEAKADETKPETGEPELKTGTDN